MNSYHQKNEFLIVGQGIAGTLLAYFFWLKKQPFRVIDKRLPGASSPIGAGIINPITGRRFVKSWRFDELSSFAKETYFQLGLFLGAEVYQEKNILWALANVFEMNEWDRRSSFPEYAPFFIAQPDLTQYKNLLKPAFAWGEITRAARVDFPVLINTFRGFLREKKLLQNEVFNYEALVFEKEKVFYDKVYYDKIIFCEGAKGAENPYFKYLPFALAKGEVLLIRIDNWKTEKLVKNNVYITPFKDNFYWAGSTNSFQFGHSDPTTKQFDFLKTKIENVLNVPFEIVAHHAGIRPTISDKRPLLGVHPEHKQFYLFNGLGTKGASLGPFFANQLVQHIVDGDPIDKEVDVRRFSKTKKEE